MAYLKISIHTTRVGGDWVLTTQPRKQKISIHTTSVGGDAFYQLPTDTPILISIHTTRVGGDAREVEE